MKRVKLEKHIKLVGGGTPSKKKSEYWNGDISWASVKDFKSKILTETVDKITNEGLENSSSKLVEKGNLIIATRMAVGKAVMTEIDVAINQDLKAVYTSEELDNKYLQYFFDSQTDYFERTGKGATVKGIKIGDIQNLEIPLPSLSEQKAIVAKLDRAQRLIDIDKEMLAKYDELIQSVFLEMFGDPVTNPKGWEVRKLGDVVGKLIAGKSFKSTDDDSGDYRVIKTGAVSWNTFDKSESKPLPPDYEPPNEHLISKGDILISRMNTSELVGASVLIRDKIDNYTIPDRIWKVKWKSKYSQTLNYFWQCINHKSFRKEISKIATGTSGSMKNMSKKKMFNMNVILPPIELQKKFDEICDKVENQKKQLYNSLKKSEELFSSLVQGAFG